LTDKFVKENHARFGVSGALEYTSNIGFRFTDIHVQKFGALHGKKVERKGCSNSFGEKGFPCSRGAI
jgi:hypothetical protein